MLTLVVTLRVEKIGWLMTFCVRIAVSIVWVSGLKIGPKMGDP